MTEATVDSSALLALILREPGSELVQDRLSRGQCAMSAVNLSEVVAKLVDRDVPPSAIREAFDSFRLDVHSFDEAQAHDAGHLRPITRAAGLSLGDRACLALAIRLATPVITTDRSWTTIALPISVILARGAAPL